MVYSRSAKAFMLLCAPSLLIFLLIFSVSEAASLPAVSSATGSASIPQTGGHGLRIPNGRLVTRSSVPPGTQTAHLATTTIIEHGSHRVVATLDGHSPRWSADGQALFLLRSNLDGTVSTLRYDVESTVTSLVNDVSSATYRPTWQQQASAIPLNVSASRQNILPPYPTTIRVLHHPQNACRAVDDWQIDVILFEEYVARAISAEVPASWPAAALEAQAVAARTYAWHQILAGRTKYDVTDWANFQMMCDLRLPSTDDAAAQTAGVYLSAKDDPKHWPIVAMYSAENGHPTLTNPNVSYLQAVPDLFSIGETRWGHGYGLSQWGAQRRAFAGHHYDQILAHYYRGVHLQSAIGTPPSMGALAPPSTETYLPRGGLTWDILTSVEAQTVTLSINGIHILPTLPASGTDTISIPRSMTETAFASLVLSGTEGVWRAPAQLAEQDVLTATLWVDAQMQETIALTVDRTAPVSPTLRWPAAITQTDIAFDVATTDAIIGMNQGWQWQGETLSHTVGSGSVISDSLASNGEAWSAEAGADQAGVWYGPYADGLPHGYRYRALFWLRAKAPAIRLADRPAAAQRGVSMPLTPLARLDVADSEGETILGLRDIWLSDFAVTDAFEPIAVDFYLFDKPNGLEFRVAWPGLIDLALDRVELWVLPERAPNIERVEWHLLSITDTIPLAFVSFDQAGNMSKPNERLLDVRDENAPQFDAIAKDRIWLSEAGGEVRIGVVDELSGLDIKSGRFVIGRESVRHETSVTFGNPAEPRQAQQAVAQVGALPKGEYVGTFQVSDRAGNVALSEEVSIYVGGKRVHIPLVQLQ